MEFRILGRLEVVERGRPLELREGRQRALLVILLLNANQVVSSARLIDELWEEVAPPTAAKMLHKHVSQLRSELRRGRGGRRPDELVVTVGQGYMIRLRADELDAIRFEALVRNARIARHAGDPATAVATLRRALELWRGRALEEFAAESFAQVHIARLEEQRMVAVQERIDADLALGRHSDVVPELETLVAGDPFRESLRAQLMLALYRSGRQADALTVYRRTYRVLSEELGIKPSLELQRLQQAILAQDPDLDLPVGGMSTVQPSVSTTVDLRSQATMASRLLPALVAGIVLVLIAWGIRSQASPASDGAGGSLASSTALGSSGPADFSGVVASPRMGSSAGTVGSPEPLLPTVLAQLSVDLPAGFGFGFDSVWVAGHHDRTLRRIDPKTNQVVQEIGGLGFQANGIIVAAGSVWVSSRDGLSRVDPGSARVTATIPGSGGGLAFGFLNVWETTLDDRLIRIDIETNEMVGAVSLGSGSVDWTNEIAIGFGSVWVAIGDENKLVRIDPSTNAIVATIEGFGDTYSGMPMAIGEGAVWIQKGTDDGGTLFRIDPATNSIESRVAVGPPGGRVAVGAGSVWTGNAPRILTQVDPDSNRVVATFYLDSAPQDVDFGFDSLWVNAYDASLVWRIAPNR